MAWLEDGTFGYSKDKLKKEFPIVATPNLRLSKNRKRIAIINDFESGSFEYELADPKIDEELEDTILHNISQSPYANKCQLHIGDARKLLKTTTFNRPIDMAFIDGDKCQYSEYYNLLIDKMSSGGVIIADNTLWNNKITCVNPKDKQLTELQKFNDYVIADSRVSTTLLPIRDGITILRVL